MIEKLDLFYDVSTAFGNARLIYKVNEIVDVLNKLTAVHNISDVKPEKICKWKHYKYKEPEVDWSKVPVDTKILVKDLESDDWFPRYFAMYKNGQVYAFTHGKTSFSADKKGAVPWAFAELAEVDDEKP